MSGKKHAVFRVRFKELGRGSRGGLGPVKSYKTTDPRRAQQKLRKHARILSVRQVK